MMQYIETEIQKPEFTGSKLTFGDKTYVVKLSDNYSYVDPVDGSQATKQVLCGLYITYKITMYHLKNISYLQFYIQGLRILFEDGSRIIYRLSGTGSSGATIRVYVDSYENDAASLNKNAQDVLKPLVNIALEISKLREYTGRDAPTVIT